MRKPATLTNAGAYDKALALVARREHSQRELKTKLAQRGFEQCESVAAIARLQTQNYQSDERFAENLIRRRIADGYGPNRITAELQSHSVEQSLTRSLIEAASPDWQNNALNVLRRRYGDIAAADFAERGKYAQFLMRRGFDADTVRKVLK